VAQQFVQDYVKEVILHEVGHALGLRHNFRASRVYTEAQLADAEFTRAMAPPAR
jgi:predicted Zn-dependent protease